MGNLIVKQVEYCGEKYYFKSPEFTTGINIIKGDNGSGKSTFSYFIEYGLGSDLKIFNKNNISERYQQIIEDKNNYVELVVSIDNEKFKFKRFIGHNDIFIQSKNSEAKMYCLSRKDCKSEIFSDWLLSKLEIKRFELNLGVTSWYFNFTDLFRLLYYDQDTELRKIYKKPNSDNFVTDSVIIRTSIFETLMGNSSDEYFLKMNELNDSKIKRKEAKVILDEFNRLNPNLKLSLNGIQVERDTLLEQIDRLLISRKNYQQEHVKIDEKFQQLEDKKRELISLELLSSETIIKKKNIEIEKSKIERLLEKEKNEIKSIENTIFTHEKLNLFDFEICPFCACDVVKKDKTCICGADIQENNYEKFLYDASEYKEILKHKNKSLETIMSALDSYGEEYEKLASEIINIDRDSKSLSTFLKDAIESIEYSGNSQITNDIDETISKVKDEIFSLNKKEEIYMQKEKYEKSFNRKDEDYKGKEKAFFRLRKSYLDNHKLIIDNFNTIYNNLMTESSAKTQSAYIDDEYMPIIDSGVYREKSATVPIRMMYYFTLLSMSLKYSTVKHPKFLLMDTPEDSGIDDNPLKKNIELFNKALELSRNGGQDSVKDYQFILTTGLEKCPEKYEQYVKLNFNKSEGRFILKKRIES